MKNKNNFTIILFFILDNYLRFMQIPKFILEMYNYYNYYYLLCPMVVVDAFL